MKPLVILLTILTLCMSAAHASDWAAQRKQRDVERATYWKARGYNFDPQYMTAYSMDRKVKDIERAKYWKQKGYDFDPDYMTAYSMDRKVKDIERAEHWKRQGYKFDPNYMTAYSMDQAVKKQKQPQEERMSSSQATDSAQRVALLHAYQEALRKQQSLAQVNDDALLSFDAAEDNDSTLLPEADNLLPQLPELPRIGVGLSQDDASPGDETKRGTYLGQWNANKYDPNSTRNPYGAGNPYNGNSINNQYGEYGNPYSSKSVRNPYATDAPKLYDADGKYRGKLSNNPYDPDSISNPYGRYGNKYSPDSIKNPYGAGNPYSPSSPNNPYGQGLSIYGDDD